MNTANASIHLDRPTESGRPGHNQRLLWSAVTIALLTGFFVEAIFAGAMLSGVAWGRRAHAILAACLIVATLAAGVFSTITLRRLRRGLTLGLALLALGTISMVQGAVGAMSAKGVNLTWAHVPLGVAVVVLAAAAVAAARGIGGERPR
jgi:hypothetical protein